MLAHKRDMLHELKEHAGKDISPTSGLQEGMWGGFNPRRARLLRSNRRHAAEIDKPCFQCLLA